MHQFDPIDGTARTMRGHLYFPSQIKRKQQGTMDQRVEKVNHQLKWWTWRRVLVAFAAVFIVLFVGSYIYNWSWTGFHDHGRLWDWLSLLLVPVIVAVLPIWFSMRQSHGSNEASKQQHQ